jgi:hypothetical protein
MEGGAATPANVLSTMSRPASKLSPAAGRGARQGARSGRAGSPSELRTPEACSKFVSGSRSIDQVEILSVRVIHTLAQKLGAGVSFSLQGKPEVAV